MGAGKRPHLGMTTSADLTQLATKYGLKHFEIPLKEHLPKLGSKKELIINIDDQNGNGTHWVAVYHDKNRKHTLYYDPFGMPILPEVKKKYDGVAITNQIQDIHSKSCGYYCIHFLVCMNNGMSVGKYLIQFSTQSKSNESVLQKFFS
jgi:hypothetical protein